MTDRWTPRLSEYLDGDLPLAERDGLEAHLRTCTACADVLVELEAVVRRAGSLPDTEPTLDLWPAIAHRLASGDETPVARWQPRARRITATLPQLAAAAIVVSLISGATAWLISSRAAPAPAPAVVVAEAPVRDALTPAAEASYRAAVEDLRRVLDADRAKLDTVTVRIVEHNLALIDRAIDDARRALAADPSNAYVSAHLAQAMKRKLDLLRRAATLAARAS